MYYVVQSSCVCFTHAPFIQLLYFTATSRDIWTTFAASLHRMPRDVMTRIPCTYPRQIPRIYYTSSYRSSPAMGGRLYKCTDISRVIIRSQHPFVARHREAWVWIHPQETCRDQLLSAPPYGASPRRRPDWQLGVADARRRRQWGSPLLCPPGVAARFLAFFLILDPCPPSWRHSHAQTFATIRYEAPPRPWTVASPDDSSINKNVYEGHRRRRFPDKGHQLCEWDWLQVFRLPWQVFRHPWLFKRKREKKERILYFIISETPWQIAILIK